ncbi:MAG: sulfurtransferase [Gammaproteobacteria bacterium]|nr:sulfurtransferase [Gammaproteobacteria bacterium]
MNKPGLLSLLISNNELKPHLHQDNLLIVDMRDYDDYRHAHVPGAVHLDYADISVAAPPALGVLPPAEILAHDLAQLGLTPQHHVVAYDDKSGVNAARLFWTLSVIQHLGGFSLLNGGFFDWFESGHATSNTPPTITPSTYPMIYQSNTLADHQYILDNLNNPKVVLLDCRSIEEYTGAVARAHRGGHIPGAINMDWLTGVDLNDKAKIKNESKIRATYENNGITPDKEIIVYCHTHCRSAHTYFILKLLNYPNVRAYAGSWSEWGNMEVLPIATGSPASQ